MIANVRPLSCEFTPHARGSTVRGYFVPHFRLVYPACAGIDRSPEYHYLLGRGLPRMRGDRPPSGMAMAISVWFTPHARGSTSSTSSTTISPYVYPACAGIDLSSSVTALGLVCLPRMRGDRPIIHRIFSRRLLFTPHARGSTTFRHETIPDPDVYPACAGIDPSSLVFPRRPQCLPRMRGDRPEGRIIYLTPSKFTPHARGSTRPILDPLSWFGVYPACAGIDLVRRI